VYQVSTTTTSGYLGCPTISNNILVWQLLLIVMILDWVVQAILDVPKVTCLDWPRPCCLTQGWCLVSGVYIGCSWSILYGLFLFFFWHGHNNIKVMVLVIGVHCTIVCRFPNKIFSYVGLNWWINHDIEQQRSISHV
jgi:hypothetical protein